MSHIAFSCQYECCWVIKYWKYTSSASTATTDSRSSFPRCMPPPPPPALTTGHSVICKRHSLQTLTCVSAGKPGLVQRTQTRLEKRPKQKPSEAILIVMLDETLRACESAAFYKVCVRTVTPTLIFLNIASCKITKQQKLNWNEQTLETNMN